MAADTILTAFRSISDLTTDDFTDSDVTDKAEPYALDQYNDIMDTSYTITTHTTGEGYNVDRALAFWCASFAYQNLYPHMTEDRKRSWIHYEQIALNIMQKIEPSKVGYSVKSNMYYAIREKRGNAQFNTYQSSYTV